LISDVPNKNTVAPSKQTFWNTQKIFLHKKIWGLATPLNSAIGFLCGSSFGLQINYMCTAAYILVTPTFVHPCRDVEERGHWPPLPFKRGAKR